MLKFKGPPTIDWRGDRARRDAPSHAGHCVNLQFLQAELQNAAGLASRSSHDLWEVPLFRPEVSSLGCHGDSCHLEVHHGIGRSAAQLRQPRLADCFRIACRRSGQHSAGMGRWRSPNMSTDPKFTSVLLSSQAESQAEIKDSTLPVCWSHFRAQQAGRRRGHRISRA